MIKWAFNFGFYFRQLIDNVIIYRNVRFQAFECSVLLKRLKTLFRGDLSIELKNNLSSASYFSYGLNFFITYAVNVWYRIVFCFE